MNAGSSQSKCKALWSSTVGIKELSMTRKWNLRVLSETPGSISRSRQPRVLSSVASWRPCYNLRLNFLGSITARWGGLFVGHRYSILSTNDVATMRSMMHLALVLKIWSIRLLNTLLSLA